MAIKKISELPQATTVNADDQVVLNQGGVTKRAPVSLLPSGGSGSGSTAPSASQLAAAAAVDGAELLVIQRLSTTVKLTATTISAVGADNSINDSGGGFLAAGFSVGQAVHVQGFTGSSANNVYSATITAASAGKLVFGGADGDVIADDAAGESVTITAWESVRASAAQVAALSGSGSSSGSVPGHQVVAVPAGFKIDATNPETTPTSRTFALPIVLLSPMYVASLVMRASSGATGIVKWGLFSYSATAATPSASPAAAVQVVGGSGALSSSGVREIAADSAPVLIPAGNYMLLIRFPDANVPSVYRANTGGSNTAPGINQRKKDGVAWGGAIDLTTGWADDIAVLWAYVRGQLNASVPW